MRDHSADKQEIERIIKRGCCLGKYRVPLHGVYYCYLEDIFNCKNQDKQYVRNLNSSMFICKTNYQKPCEECEQYKKSEV